MIQQGISFDFRECNNWIWFQSLFLNFGSHKICYEIFRCRKWKIQLQKKSGSPSLVKAVAWTFWREYSIFSCMSLFSDIVFRLTQPLLLGELLRFFRYNVYLIYCFILFSTFIIFSFQWRSRDIKWTSTMVCRWNLSNNWAEYGFDESNFHYGIP